MTASTKIAVLATACACVLSSCDRQGDPGLKERISLLEAEVSQREDSLKNLKEEITAKEKESSAASESAAPAVIDPAKARQAYLAAVESIQASLGKALGSDGTVQGASISPVVGPDPDYPISSKVAFTIVAKNGRKGEIVVPLVANAAGEWKQPSADSIAADFRKSLSSLPAVADNTGTTPAPQPQPRPQPQPQAKPQPTDVMGANRTVQVGWDEPTAAPQPPARATNPAPQPQPTPQPPASKPAPQQPVKPMPSNRDVIIDFDR
ncbi:hypothetical protein [Luteolibacter sp. LG18]|uniref:hypothetical protein n=1 Tax=Luteolibacter sp. LG18 TaxID=2819286 RepID=UPI002B2CBA62|nr:hypothetical protein llg_17730 [Luteolibacter sp. LG18]